MRKIILTIALMGLLAGAALADTLYLRNGSVLKGTLIGYENGQFIFELEGGRQVKYRPNEVTRLVIERDLATTPSPGYPSRDPNETLPNWESIPAFNVPLEDQWIRTQVQLTRGQRVRVQASGTVYLEGRTATTPDGLSGRRDQDAPLPDANDGALVAAIGQDPNSPAIFIGSSREFVAEQDGVLYFTVNHWETRDARGAFRVNVSVDRNVTASGGTVPTQGREKTITVAANQQWTDTGIDVEPNMTFEIIAEGEITITSRFKSGPDGNQDAMVRNATYPVQDHGVGALIGKIRYRNGQDSNFIFLGARSTPQTEPNEYGRLFLGINDDYLRDNRGSYRVTIRW
ncbi:MAG: hypothetical protein IPM66_12840 [Acidobacteriota bacterium]|nr:MAG: hypothetical protein IPM66_12840 [Acidobacteriota bacterium]